MPNDALKLLQDAAGYTEKEADEMFIITEQNGEWVIRAYRYLDGSTFGKLLRAISDRGGGYRKDETTKFAIFTLPKTPSPQGMDSEPVYKEAGNEIPTEPSQEGEYALSKSLKGKLGQLVPCLQDAEGMIIDGFHRLKINPKAWTVKNDQIKTPVDRALARMTVNFCRRHYTSEEMKNDIGLLSGSGYSAQDIQDITGIGLTTIYKYYPQQLKDEKKVEAGKLGGEAKAESFATQVKQTVKTQDTFVSTPAFARTQQEMAQQVIDCELCGKPMDRSRGSIVGGKIVCPKCAGKDKPLTVRKLEEEPTFKPKEKPEFRKAVMQPQKSKFELEVIQQLQAEGLPLETDQEFCIQKTVPDAILKLKDRTIAIYIDNVATHEEGDERDEFLRSRLEKLHPEIHVCVVQYKNDSVEERQRAKETIKEFLKW
jgi:hypothetical protein